MDFQELLQILACPDCRSPVEYRDEKIICKGCGLRYPVRDGIPVMLVSEAEKPPEGKQASAADPKS